GGIFPYWPIKTTWLMTFLAATVLLYHINDTFCLHTARIRFYFPSIVDDTFSLLLCGFSWAQKNRCLVASVSDFIFNSNFSGNLASTQQYSGNFFRRLDFILTICLNRHLHTSCQAQRNQTHQTFGID